VTDKDAWRSYWHEDLSLAVGEGASRGGGVRWDAFPTTVQRLILFIRKNRQKQNIWPATLLAYLDVVTGVAQRENTAAIPGFGPAPTADDQVDDVFTLGGRRLAEAPDWLNVDKWLPHKQRRHLASVYMLDRIVVAVYYFRNREDMREWGRRFSDAAYAQNRTNAHIMTMRWAARGHTVGEWVADSQQTGARYTKSKSLVWPSKLALAGDGVLRVIRETRGVRDAHSKFRQKSILAIGKNARAWQADAKARRLPKPKPTPRPRGEQPTLFGRTSRPGAEWLVWQDARGQYVRARA
jgi:hypothetical protein